MTAELYWLVLTAVFTGLMWVPYILKMIIENGLVPSLTSTQGTRTPDAPWAARLKKAHANGVENLVIFAPLVIVLVMSGKGTELTEMAAMVYFGTRVAHAVIFTLGLPVLRTIAFAVGVGCQIVLALTLLDFMGSYVDHAHHPLP